MKNQTTINELEETGNYKVFNKLNTDSGNTVFNEYDDDQVCIGVYVDVETTGLDHTENEIIEVGMVKFEYGRNTGVVYKVIDQFDEFQEPSQAITQEITDITGITNEMVSGHNIDTEELEVFIADANLIIAFNSKFDRKFLEDKFSVFKKMPWACSLDDVNWEEEGFRTKSLEFLSFKFGFVYEAHRADIDCLAGVTLLSQSLPKSGIPVMRNMLENARKEKSIIKAVKAPFAAKDVLKEKGYKWNAEEKVWWTLVSGDEATAVEIDFLNKEIYFKERFRPESIPVKKINFMDRFSVRE